MRQSAPEIRVVAQVLRGVEAAKPRRITEGCDGVMSHALPGGVDVPKIETRPNVISGLDIEGPYGNERRDAMAPSAD